MNFKVFGIFFELALVVCAVSAELSTPDEVPAVGKNQQTYSFCFTIFNL